MDVEVHYQDTRGGTYWDTPAEQQQLTAAMDARKAELEDEGHKVLIVPTGGSHPWGSRAC